MAVAGRENDGDDVRGRLRRAVTSTSSERLRGARSGPDHRIQAPAGPEPAATRPADIDAVQVKARLLARLLDEIEETRDAKRQPGDVRRAVRSFAERVLEEEGIPLNAPERTRLASELEEEALGLGPLATLMRDPAVTDILVNAPDLVYVERHGRLERSAIRFRDEDHILRIIERIAAWVGRRIDVAVPMLDARLPDGSRVNATLPPMSVDGPTLSIRRFGVRRLRRDDLVRLGMLSPTMREVLDLAVRYRFNLIVSGGTGAGKSTLLGALAEAIPPSERLVTMEDTVELVLDREHVVRLETRPPNIEGQGRITARDLVINALRMRPDRIIVGEVRGPEAADMLQAMNTGHDGGMTTIHANSPRDALRRLETMVLMAGLDLPSRAIREQMVAALHLVVHVRRYEDGVRRVESIAEIVGLEGETPLLDDVFRFVRRGGGGRRIDGSFEPTGIVPRFVDVLGERGIQVQRGLFGAPGAGS